jgi:transcriptional regulator with XRE-family HTH domain
MGKFLSSVEIGNKIKMLRRHAGLTQEKLAELVGVSFQQIQKYENGSTRLNTDKLQQVAHALKIPVEALFEKDTFERPPLSEREKKVMRAFRGMGDDIQECFVKILLNTGKKNTK